MTVKEKAKPPVKQTKGKRQFGDGTPGPGRPKGLPNKVTTEFRETVKKLLEDNSANVGKWLKAVAEGDPLSDTKPSPEKALDLLAKLAEFAAPKLARTEHVGDGGGPVRIVASTLDEKL